MQADDTQTLRKQEVWSRLEEVCDPELDEPVTDMGFVEDIDIDFDTVRVAFRLPTYWCSPNFAFLMAEGIRREVGALPWVAVVEVDLRDHLCADEMNAAVNAGVDFAEAFALREDGGDLSEVREKFERKAFQRRQESVILALKAMGLTPDEIAGTSLARMDMARLADPEARRQRRRYRALLVSRRLALREGDHAFPDLDGAPLTAETFKDRMGQLRAVRINMEFGGALCRGLMQSRYKETVHIDGEPTLVDFILDRVPPRTTAG